VVRLHRIVVLLAAAALTAPAAVGAYPWPLKPFGKQHAVRGNFDDPRITESGGAAIQESFHFGIDISGADGTPVYSVSRGVALPRGNRVTVRQANGREFAYWHIYPVVHRWQPIRLHQLLGYIVRGYGHVHFAENVDGNWVNPLRRGGIAPYEDYTRPTVENVQFESGETTIDPLAVAGVVDVVADAWDTPPIAPPPPWNGAKLSPALIRWRIVTGPEALARWRISVDFRWSLLPQADFSLVYAPGTRQNRPNRPGRYVYYLLHDWDTTALPNGSYRLEVEAVDSSGNVGSAEVPFVVAN
jgi:hypothetical protein